MRSGGAAQPQAHAWTETEHPLRLVELAVASNDPDPKALACYGVLLRQTGCPEQVWLRFVDGRPVSAITTRFLACAVASWRRGVSRSGP